MNTSTIVQMLWNYCNLLRDDGLSYGDYVEHEAPSPQKSGRGGVRGKVANEQSRPPLVVQMGRLIVVLK